MNPTQEIVIGVIFLLISVGGLVGGYYWQSYNKRHKIHASDISGRLRMGSFFMIFLSILMIANGISKI